MPWAVGHFDVLGKMNNNSYKVDIPGEFGVPYMFNVAGLKPYFSDDNLENLRVNSLQHGEDDVPMEGSLGMSK